MGFTIPSFSHPIKTQYEHYYPPDEHSFKPQYTLHEFLCTQFDEINLQTFWNTMHRIFKNKEKICLVINAKDPEYYAGQRGFFYMLDFVCERYDMWAYPGLLEAKYSAHYNADFENWDPESAKWNYAGETEAEIIILNSHFRLTPETAMNTNHFTNMARQWAETIASEC